MCAIERVRAISLHARGNDTHFSSNGDRKSVKVANVKMALVSCVYNHELALRQLTRLLKGWPNLHMSVRVKLCVVSEGTQILTRMNKDKMS